MDKKIKTLIADKKLSDEFILQALESALTAESSDADEEQNDDTDDASEVEETVTIEQEVDEDASTDEEQPDIDALVEQKVMEVLGRMKTGKKPPKVKAKLKETKKVAIHNQFGAL